MGLRILADLTVLHGWYTGGANRCSSENYPIDFVSLNVLIIAGSNPAGDTKSNRGVRHLPWLLF